MTETFLSTIRDSTQVTFPEGKLTGRSRVLEVWQLPRIDPKVVILTESTPFHPEDHAWPDQPGDRGIIRIGDSSWDVNECQTAAVNIITGEAYLGGDIPARRGEAGWAFLVAHLVEHTDDILNRVGENCELEVDPDRRLGLSRAHTACHLMSLAMNKATSHLWTKDSPATDSLGNPHLDQLAIQSSRLTELQSVDHYRTGKSLRKKGFTTARFIDESSDIARSMHETVADWIATDSAVRIEVPDAALTARRVWHATLDGQPVAIPCGGTHVRSLSEIGVVQFEIAVGDDGSSFSIITHVS